MAVQLGLDLSEAHKHRLEQLNELDEIRKDVVQRTNIVQQQRAKCNDKYIKEKKFHVGDWALFSIQNSNIFKESLRLIGLGLMRLKKSLIMEQ